MSTLSIFRYEGADVRTLLLDGEPWWVLADVCAAVGIANPRNVALRLDDDEKGVHQMDTPGGKQSLTIINESGMYSTILRSDSADAKAFKRWLVHDVLPAIRKTGVYAAPTEPKSELDVIREQHAAIGRLLELREVDAPKVAAYDRLQSSVSLVKVEVAARKAGVGRTTAFKLLRQAGIFSVYGNTPTARHAHRFDEVASTHTNHLGETVTDFTTKVRSEHLDWLVVTLERLASGDYPKAISA